MKKRRRGEARNKGFIKNRKPAGGNGDRAGPGPTAEQRIIASPGIITIHTCRPSHAADTKKGEREGKRRRLLRLRGLQGARQKAGRATALFALGVGGPGGCRCDGDGKRKSVVVSLAQQNLETSARSRSKRTMANAWSDKHACLTAACRSLSACGVCLLHVRLA